MLCCFLNPENDPEKVGCCNAAPNTHTELLVPKGCGFLWALKRNSKGVCYAFNRDSVWLSTPTLGLVMIFKVADSPATDAGTVRREPGS